MEQVRGAEVSGADVGPLPLRGDGSTEDSIDTLVDLVKSHQNWNDEAARTQLLKIFDALGHADPITVEGRRKLSAVLFS